MFLLKTQNLENEKNALDKLFDATEFIETHDIMNIQG